MERVNLWEFFVDKQVTPKFTLQLTPAYSTFIEGKPADVPYVIDGLLIQGGLSWLAGKPKEGKSSFMRYECACVAKGAPCLGRKCQQGEVIIMSLEDPLSHSDNCLKALGYDPAKDAPIHFVNRLSPSITESLDALGDALTKMPNVSFVAVDTAAKLLRVKDMSDYSEVMGSAEKLHMIAKQFPKLHIQGTMHCKKARQDDPFDALLGSTAIRGESDTNLAIVSEQGQRVLHVETRIGRAIEPTLLNATLQESAGAMVVKDFSLGPPLRELSEEASAKRERKKKVGLEDQIIDFLQSFEDKSCTQEKLLSDVTGQRAAKLATINRLVAECVLDKSGTPHSPTDPLRLTLNPKGLEFHNLGNGRFQAASEEQ